MLCNSIISDNEIKSIYEDGSADHVSLLKNECRFDATSKYVFIEVKKDNVYILDKPIIWDYLKESRLYKNAPTSGYGKVAKYEQIEIKSKFRDDKIAKKFDEKAVEVYRRNAFQEIQLSAIRDGILVWPKLFYKFLNPNDEKKILMEFEKYLLVIHNYTDDNERNGKMAGVTSIEKLPKRLIMPTDGKVFFADWLSDKIKENKVSILSKLYKEVL